MPLPFPSLDDRNFDDLVEELIARIPAHTPEWTNPRVGDPGRTLLELFAWLGDTLLYRANRIPERQRLAFLRLLGVQMRPAIAAQGIVSLAIADPAISQSVTLQPGATIKRTVAFETRSEATVFPVTAVAYYKRALNAMERSRYGGVVEGLQQVYRLNGANQPSAPYFVEPVFAGGAADPTGFDLVQRSLDQSLWLAILAPSKAQVETVKTALGSNSTGGAALLNVGIMPTIAIPEEFEEIRPRARLPFVWQISTGREVAGQPQYIALNVVDDTTGGLTRGGIIRLGLPATSDIGAPSNDVRTPAGLMAGTGDRPPRLDAPDLRDRLVTWLRLRPGQTGLRSLSLSWVGINAVAIDQRQTLRSRVVGESDGSADQVFQLPGQSIERETLRIQVEETGQGYQLWQSIDDLALAGREVSNGSVYQLDAEAGTIRFGDGLRGRIPEAGRRIRVALMRAGGGTQGNLPPGSLTEVASATDLRDRPMTTKLTVLQQLPITGGSNAETLDEAEQRIPALFRHRDRAVTADDYRQLVIEAPGVRVGRVQVLPRFKPQQRRENVPGVVSVMVLPFQEAIEPPNPRPDRPFLETIHAYLDQRRPLGTELYVIGCEYKPLGISLAVQIQEEFGQDGVLVNVREALRRFLWPLSPGGAAAQGWLLGRDVQDRELEVIVARVPGISSVEDLRLFQKPKKTSDWQRIAPSKGKVAALSLAPWQLPELLSVVAIVGTEAPTALGPIATPTPGAIAIPVVPEVC